MVESHVVESKSLQGFARLFALIPETAHVISKAPKLSVTRNGHELQKIEKPALVAELGRNEVGFFPPNAPSNGSFGGGCIDSVGHQLRKQIDPGAVDEHPVDHEPSIFGLRIRRKHRPSLVEAHQPRKTTEERLFKRDFAAASAELCACLREVPEGDRRNRQDGHDCDRPLAKSRNSVEKPCRL